MAKAIAGLDKGAAKGLRALGFVHFDDLPLSSEEPSARNAEASIIHHENLKLRKARIVKAFVSFYDMINNPDPKISGVSPELHKVCCLLQHKTLRMHRG